ncbi:holo-ACP synthase [Alkalihalobacterium alkalinitrilicum]|uniref:holo-ACP synthase n=1 Tax=Alkalihalobacterium alkalinitrilicum TaxID=427920 RepID=UPI000994B2E3|nr:holo-ACP synthase [Alkalihalobacterium alkalinitrilicum]
MIKGIGIDIVEIARIKQAIERTDKFILRILTENERKKYHTLTKQRQFEYVAGRFAAKEAFVKAIGTGISKEVGWQDIEVVNDVNSGKPSIAWKGNDKVHVSISHSKEFAVAQVIIESLSS